MVTGPYVARPPGGFPARELSGGQARRRRSCVNSPVMRDRASGNVREPVDDTAGVTPRCSACPRRSCRAGPGPRVRPPTHPSCQRRDRRRHQMRIQDLERGRQARTQRLGIFRCVEARHWRVKRNGQRNSDESSSRTRCSPAVESGTVDDSSERRIDRRFKPIASCRQEASWCGRCVTREGAA
jgi:hypothetical protein